MTKQKFYMAEILHSAWILVFTDFIKNFELINPKIPRINITLSTINIPSIHLVNSRFNFAFYNMLWKFQNVKICTFQVNLEQSNLESCSKEGFHGFCGKEHTHFLNISNFKCGQNLRTVHCQACYKLVIFSQIRSWCFIHFK